MRSRVQLVALFAIYLVLLTWIVLWKLHAPSVGDPWLGTIKVVPFAAARGFGANDPVLMNTAGGALGLILASFFAHRRHAGSRTIITWACTLGTVIVVKGAGGVIASFPEPPPLHGTPGQVSSTRQGIGG